MPPTVLGPRALNRATLERQLLLRRAAIPALEAVEHLVGMQAQVPLNPYHGLWSRLQDFDPHELGRLMLDRKVVRTVVMRGTIHLVSGGDCLLLRPLMQPVLDGELARHPEYAPALEGVDLAPVLDFARPLLADRAHSGRELRAAMTQRFPEHNAAALAMACRNLLALVQVPPRGVWGRTAQVSSTTAEAWLGRPLVADPSIDDVVLRYLGAFGPATVADISSWSRLAGMRAVVDRLAPRLRTFRDERGRELFDLPDAPRPDPDTPAPPRFLPEYDNVLLSHADRSRFASDSYVQRRVAPPAIHGCVLSDGVICATWRSERDRISGVSTLFVDQVARLTKRETSAVVAEGRRLMRLLAGGAGGGTPGDVRFTPPA